MEFKKIAYKGEKTSKKFTKKLMLSTLYFAYINFALCTKLLLIQAYVEDDWFDDEVNFDPAEYIANFPYLPPIVPLNLRRVVGQL